VLSVPFVFPFSLISRLGLTWKSSEAAWCFINPACTSCFGGPEQASLSSSFSPICHHGASKAFKQCLQLTPGCKGTSAWVKGLLLLDASRRGWSMSAEPALNPCRACSLCLGLTSPSAPLVSAGLKTKPGKPCFGQDGQYAKEACLKESAVIAFA